ncbi:MAG: hypothetical protein KC613_23090 [Myxococcales bacterium]|nr:hypothetical protein [Myxococcales bacterium]MCB9526163.1 hypothetical protein [Myxococcales bacterium]
MRRLPLTPIPLLALSLMLALPALAAPIETWVRPAGDPLVVEHQRAQAGAFDVQAAPMQAHELMDLQYGGKRQFKALSLWAVIDQVAPKDPKVDGVLLRFANGMAVPLPLEPTGREKLKLWIARAVWVDGQWRAELPPISQGDRDPRPLKFKGHKLVAETPFHPFANPDADFSPWRHVDTLVGLEFVNLKAWYGQFQVDEKASPQGTPVYKTWCTHCHGVRRVGARFGWDFVDPLPAVDQRPTVSDLLFHVRYRATDATQLGLMMPAMKRFTRGEGERLHAWLRVLIDKPLKAYEP